MSLINKAELKRFLLDRAKTMRPGHEFSRVSEEALEYLESQVRNAAVELIRRHPSKGVTIKP
jgi:histone H3/H4